MATGEEEVAKVMMRAAELGLAVEQGSALDFGCGVGRLTRALAKRHENVSGVDVSQVMLDEARKLNAELGNVQWLLNDRPDLSLFDDASFELVYTNVVLQHLPTAEAALAYIREFFRVTRPGGTVIFQLPTHIALKQRLQPRRRAYAILRTLRIPKTVLYARLGLMPMRMQAVEQARVEAVIQSSGGTLLAADPDDVGHAHVQSARYFCRR